MRRPIIFQFRFDKFVAAMTYMASKVPDLTKLRASKLLYFADKYHLTSYGRPIIGDQYVKMEHGPVPSEAYDWMDDLIAPVRLKGVAQPKTNQLREHLEFQVSGRHPVFKAKKKPNLSSLSESDLEALDYAIKKYGRLTVTALLRAGHRERPWKESATHWIDYRLFFDKGDPDQLAVLEYVQDQADSEDLLEELAAE